MEIGILQVRWFTERFNRLLLRFGRCCPGFLKVWFGLGALLSSLLILPSIYILVQVYSWIIITFVDLRDLEAYYNRYCRINAVRLYIFENTCQFCVIFYILKIYIQIIYTCTLKICAMLYKSAKKRNCFLLRFIHWSNSLYPRAEKTGL